MYKIKLEDKKKTAEEYVASQSNKVARWHGNLGYDPQDYVVVIVTYDDDEAFWYGRRYDWVSVTYDVLKFRRDLEGLLE